jgi:hypothetical protein
VNLNKSPKTSLRSPTIKKPNKLANVTIAQLKDSSIFSKEIENLHFRSRQAPGLGA